MRGDVGGPGPAYAFFKPGTSFPSYLITYGDATLQEKSAAKRPASASPPVLPPPTLCTASDGTVLPPLSFDVTVSVGSSVQAAVDGCRPGGFVLLSPGTHEGPLSISKEVHLFGMGVATLQSDGKGSVITSTAAKATVADLAIRKLPVDGASLGDYGVWIKGGGLRLQGCDVKGEAWSGIAIEGGASTDPLVVGCK